MDGRSGGIIVGGRAVRIIMGDRNRAKGAAKAFLPISAFGSRHSAGKSAFGMPLEPFLNARSHRGIGTSAFNSCPLMA